MVEEGKTADSNHPATITWAWVGIWPWSRLIDMESPSAIPHRA